MSLTRGEFVTLIGEIILDVLMELDPSDYYVSDRILSTNEINVFHDGAELTASRIFDRVLENLINK